MSLWAVAEASIGFSRREKVWGCQKLPCILQGTQQAWLTRAHRAWQGSAGLTDAEAASATILPLQVVAAFRERLWDNNACTSCGLGLTLTTSRWRPATTIMSSRLLPSDSTTVPDP